MKFDSAEVSNVYYPQCLRVSEISALAVGHSQELHHPESSFLFCKIHVKNCILKRVQGDGSAARRSSAT
jgi:hypothetical protein